MPFLYRDFIKTVSTRFDANLTYLQAIWNFDLGREFEVAICKTLRAALPSRFGVCRGHVVASNGGSADDDIITYDRQLFPTLRLIRDEDYCAQRWMTWHLVSAYRCFSPFWTMSNLEGSPGQL
ncbi:DUF6602 domain-containing protein [Singulisphaera sp. GP187]|uniref:DUF6602 domain-containing protein n=1 Tax=Singulisphaera sp. GP187 TaxID=1882752 RepID=UPI0039658747